MQNLQLRLKQKILGEHTGVSSETYLSIAWNVLAVTPPLFILLKPIQNANTKWSDRLFSWQSVRIC